MLAPVLTKVLAPERTPERVAVPVVTSIVRGVTILLAAEIPELKARVVEERMVRAAEPRAVLFPTVIVPAERVVPVE